MTAVKTAVSLEEHLLARIDDLAQEMQIPRSRLIALAAEKFLRDTENRRILARLDQVYGIAATEDEIELRKRRKAHHRRLVEGEW